MEEWDIYDKELNKTGKTCIRGKYKLLEGEYHLVVHIWIFTKDGKILLTQRSENKETDPLKWEGQGGSVLKGENSLAGAKRETKEEIGLDLADNQFKEFRKERRDHYNDFFVAYYAILDEHEIEKIQFTDGEVVDKKLVTIEEFNELFEQGEIVNNLYYMKEDYKKIFSI